MAARGVAPVRGEALVEGEPQVFVAEREGVKAAGGIRTYSDALKMIDAGASRLGTSSGVRIIEECPE